MSKILVTFKNVSIFHRNVVEFYNTLSSDIESLFNSFEKKDIPVSEIVNSVSERGFGIILILTSLPSALPVPAAGYSIPFGIVIILIALQIMLGKKTLWLPQFLLQRKISNDYIQKLKNPAVKLIKKVEYISKPRLFIVSGSQFYKSFISLFLILMGCFMLIALPFTNTFPAFCVFIIGLGLLNEDGVILLLSVVLSIGVAIFTGAVFWIYFTLGKEALTSFQFVIEYIGTKLM